MSESSRNTWRESIDTTLRSDLISKSIARAMLAAQESDRRYGQAEPRALEGVPVAIKANIAVAGLEWNAGMEARRGIVAPFDADAVARRRAAGAIVLGTLNMHEAALGATTDNPWFGRAINPHREGYTPGGSSGGSGAAVAAGLCMAALGTDTLGSIRIPAAYNGIYGIKPTAVAVSSVGLVPVSEQFDCIGPLARSLDDLSAVLNVLMNVRAPIRLRRVLMLERLDGLDCEPGLMPARASNSRPVRGDGLEFIRVPGPESRLAFFTRHLNRAFSIETSGPVKPTIAG